MIVPGTSALRSTVNHIVADYTQVECRLLRQPVVDLTLADIQQTHIHCRHFYQLRVETYVTWIFLAPPR